MRARACLRGGEAGGEAPGAGPPSAAGRATRGGSVEWGGARPGRNGVQRGAAAAAGMMLRGCVPAGRCCLLSKRILALHAQTPAFPPRPRPPPQDARPGPAVAPRLPAGAVLVRRLFAGVNASDINYTSGRYVSLAPLGGE